MKIPFGLMPGSWGLKGKTRDIAKAEYELTGYALDKRIAEITGDESPEKLAAALRKVELKHGKITQYEFRMQQAQADLTGVELNLAIRTINLEYGKITQQEFNILDAHAYLTGVALDARLLEIEYDNSDMTENEFNKKLADIKSEPYIAVISSDYDPDQDVNGFYFEFDWNQKWIELLTSHGYTGFTEEQMVQKWFQDLCRGVISESMESEPVPFNSNRIINRTPRDGGTTDYS